ncbi:MAG: two-component system sensor kinase FixL [Gammaproteobacteria bacterium]|jgi:two-component system sensor kinase FixL
MFRSSMSFFSPRDTPSRGRAVSVAVASGYAVFGFLWVLLAKWVLEKFVDDPETLTRLGNYNDWLFVTLTTILVYVLVRLQTESLERFSRESEARLRQIIDLVPHMIFAKDEHGRFILANRAVADAYAADSADALTGKRQADLHSDRAEATRMQADDDRVIESGRPLSRPEQPFTDAKLNRRYLETSRIPYRISGSEEPAVLAVSVDVTRRRAIEQRLRQREELLGLIIENAPTPIASADVSGRLNSANRAWCEMLGYSESELKLMTFRDITVEDDVEPSHTLLQRAMLGELDTYKIRKRYIRRNGEPVEVILHNGVVHDEDGNPLLLVAQAEDLTERLLAEEEARVQQEHLAHVDRLNIVGEMAAGIAHEINQPLTAIVNRTSAARRRLDAGQVDIERLKDSLNRVNEQAFRAGEVVRRLRTLVRSQGGSMEFVDVNDLITEAMALAEVDARIHDLYLDIQLAQDLPEILADKVQVQQVILNLVRNAIDAMEQVVTENRVIAVRSFARPDRMVEVTIADCGAGLSEAAADHMFDPFFTTKAAGMGLGLAISASIIRAHDGKIWFERSGISGSDTAGTTFHFTLPASVRDRDGDIA